MRTLLLIKRYLDIIVSSFAIILLIPVWILLSLAIFLEDRHFIIFKQHRAGKDEKIFTIYKFRSMVVNNIPPLELGAIKHNHYLVTRVGYFMRRLKLDETLQFLNVLKGDMSLVGPRPCLPSRIQSMSIIEMQRFKLLPGVTGWAEVNGNIELTWEEQLLFDLWYVQHWSLYLDIKILLKTVAVVVWGSKKNELALANAKSIFNDMRER